MAHTAIDDALEFIHWIEKRSNLHFLLTDQTRMLKLELRFLSACLKYTANRCTDNETLQQLLTSMEDMGRNLMKKLQPRLSLWLYFPSIFYDAVDDVVQTIQPVKPKMRKVQMQVSFSGSASRMSDGLVLEFFYSLVEDLKESLGCRAADFLQSSLNEGINVLERKLTSLKGLLSFTVKRCSEYDQLSQLFTHVQAVADNAAFLAYPCLINEIDEDMESGLGFQLSDLVQRIDLAKPEVRGIYIGVLRTSKSSDAKLNTYGVDQTVVDFVNSVLENTSELLCLDIVPMKDQTEVLHKELASLSYFLKDKTERFIELGKSNDFSAEIEDMAIDAGLAICSLFEGDANQEVFKETRLALPRLLDKFKLVRQNYVNIVKAHISNFPRIGVLGALHHILRNFKEFLNDNGVSITLLKDYILIIQRDLQFLESFLTTITKQPDEQGNLKDLWNRIKHVIYEVEYVTDLVAIKDGLLLQHELWLLDLIEEINLVKTQINENQNSDKNIHGMEERGITKKSSVRVSSQGSAPRIDEEMVGFKDEEEKVVEQLIRGSMHLQIVSIVGMAGLGKTFLAEKVYSNTIIKDHFYVQAWCSVSQVYERKELLSNILSQVNKSIGDTLEKTDQELAEMLRKCLKGQKYLIVLDDVWDIEAWEALRRSFPDDYTGNRIVFTSRFPELALQAKPNSKIHRLRTFSNRESWELLQKKIFRSESCPSELRRVGQQIAEDCNGLPLAVVVVGGLLARTTKNEQQWRAVAASLSSYIISDPQRLCMDILDLSYKNLPDYLKSCFLYLGAFPEDKEISATMLIRLWIAEGFVRDNEAANLEDIAEGYLMDLIGKSLVIASKERCTGGVKACILHDLIREFCLAKAKEENFLKLIGSTRNEDFHIWSGLRGSVPSSCSISYEQRRLLVLNELPWSKLSGPYVHSLVLFGHPWRLLWQNNEVVSSFIHGFKLLRVLNLLGIRLAHSFPTGIEFLALLRYLAIAGNFSSLPPSITKLRNLETFFVGSTFRTIEIPSVTLDLARLRHLHIYSFEFSPVSSFDNSFQLDSLQTLSKPSLSYHDMEVMRRFPNLRKLKCAFKESWDDSRMCNRLPVLDFLKNLESLNVSFVGRLRHPCEFSLPSTIKKLTMSRFRLPWERISIIGKLSNLEVLKLHDEAFAGAEWDMQPGEFPKLKVLELKRLDIRRWIASDYFPLGRLLLESCHELRKLPSCLEDIPTLNMIQVYECNIILEASIEKIRKEQEDLGNKELKIDTKRWTYRYIW